MPETTVLRASAEAPVNIAVLKYWGKEDEDTKLPLNDSVSVSLTGLRTYTTVALIESELDSVEWIYIDGESYIESDDAVQDSLKILSALKKIGDIQQSYTVRIDSKNYGPTAAGLASSASGYAAMTMAMAECLGLSAAGPKVLSQIARLGSGSASRSLHGGFVHWKRDSILSPSHSEQLFPAEHWPDLACLVIHLKSAGPKKVSSREAMARTVATSDLARHRYDPSYTGQKVSAFQHAISTRNFSAFAELTMRESNQLHAICLDSYPPVNYLNEDSWKVIQAIHALNEKEGRTVAGYTFDAGPHPVIFALKSDMQLIKSILEEYEDEMIECKVSGPAYIVHKLGDLHNHL